MKKKGKKENWRRVFLFTVITLITYFILLTSVTPKRYNLVEGDIASEDIKATRDIIDEEATAAKENEAKEMVSEQYSLKNEVKVEATQNITNFFYKLINLKSNNISESEKIATLKKIEAFKLTNTQYKRMLNLTTDQATELQWVLQDTIDKVYENNIQEDKEEDLKKARNIASENIKNTALDTDLEEILIEMANSLTQPNFIYDSEKTEEAIKDALKTVSKVMIKKNQTIVKEGEPITERQIEILTELGIVGDTVNKTSVITYLVLLLLVLMILGLELFFVGKINKELLKGEKYIIMISILNILTLLLALGINKISPFLIPLASVPIIMTALLDYRISLVMNFLNLVLVSVITGFNPQVILLGIVSIIIISATLKKTNERNDILYSTFYVALGLMVVTLSTGFLQSSDSTAIVQNMLAVVLSAILSGILSMGLLPFLESSFNIITNMRLLELANPNNALLKRLLMEAPGTYHHSIMVANLAEVAAEEVNANAIVVRVGAYYHDIGKIKRPLFFGENQMGGENPHNRISPSLSTSIILSHVKDGEELADEYKLPKLIKDIIVQHHGTTLVKYFYYTVKNNAAEGEEIDEADFRYDGPVPSTKEAAIVMLADSVEAAVRSIKEPSIEKIENMINNIVKDKLDSNQLDNCELTLKDLIKIKKSFLSVLTGIYHQRVEYPKEKAKNDK